jgi:hypothetical protein
MSYLALFFIILLANLCFFGLIILLLYLLLPQLLAWQVKKAQAKVRQKIKDFFGKFGSN